MDLLDYKAAGFWWSVFQSLVLVGLWVYSVWANRSRATKQEFENVRKELHGGLKSVREELDRAERSAENGLNRLERHFDQRLDAQGEQRSSDMSRIVAIERTLTHLPTQSDIRQLDHAIGKIGTDLAMIKGAMEPLNHITKSINQWLIDGGGKK